MSSLDLREKNNTKLLGELEALQNCFAYNLFVRKKYLEFITKLPKKTLTKDRGASYPSILDIFTHVLDVYDSWLHLYEKGEDLPEIKGLSVNEVKKLELKVDRHIDNFMRKLRPDHLNTSFQIPTKDKNEKVRTWQLKGMLWHLVEEELQHRGEMNALLWQDDIDPPVTSWWRWEKALEKKKGEIAK
jgi:uncharacterized damage-inducible protein DinB